MSKVVTKCRCCLSIDTGMKDMFAESLQSGKLKLIDGFVVCSGLTGLADNSDVVHICYACEFQLKNAFLFRKMCLDSDEKLKSSTDIVKVERPDGVVQPLEAIDDSSQNLLVAVPSDNEEDAKSDLSNTEVPLIFLEAKEENESDEDMMVEALDEYVEEVKKIKKAKVANIGFADDAQLEDIGEPEMAADDATMDLEAEFYCFVCSQYLPNYRAFAV
jgi:Zinc-finger associated domain (zf-AD)